MKRKKSVGRPALSEQEVALARGRIVSVAKQLFFDQGFSSVSIRNIADHVGCSPMAIYRYFQNKHAILRQIWVSIFREAEATLAAAIRGKRAPLARLRAAALAYGEFWLERPHYFHIVYLNVDPNSIALGEVVLNEPDSHVRAVYARLEQLLRDGVDAEELRGAPNLMLQVLVANLYGMILCVLTVPEFEWVSARQFTREIIDRFIAAHAR